MNKKKLLLLVLSFAFTWGYDHKIQAQENQMQGLEMSYTRSTSIAPKRTALKAF